MIDALKSIFREEKNLLIIFNSNFDFKYFVGIKKQISPFQGVVGSILFLAFSNIDGVYSFELKLLFS
ncbi:hypothetical protein [Bartonella sp. AR 15-3]|uniref:hypothetical protein n=1 Tax=Bartonella sp. AR 15-3 TaxID=545617 RepID=UPI0001F4C66D|nr:hypothetical protein [Bartonella sp. AR 15-3]CBI79550.1 hypothetical protein BAR15_130117 [Bartonella sp. AR 15-3]